MGKRLALIIGNSAYRDQTLTRLKTPDVDVGSLHDILKDPEVGGFDSVDLLVNSKSAIVRRAISEFFAHKSRDDLLLLYFSGHGVLDDRGRLYLAVKDTDHSLLRGTAVSASFITDEIDNSHSQRQVLILDCCHSGAFARGIKGTPGSTVGTASAFEGTGFGRVVLTATDATQYAWEGDKIIGEAENSLFTHYMVHGLQSGEADINGDGKITIDELYDYVYAQVVKQTPKQTPGKWSFKEQGEIIIARAGHPERRPPIIETRPFLDEELNQKLEQLYTKGLSAYWLEEWEQAAHYFHSILDIDTDYQDAAEKLADVRRQLSLQNLYNCALADFEAQKYPEAIAAFESLVAEAPDYKDAASKLLSAHRQGEVAELYAQAKQLYQAAQWQAVINIFDRITELTPDFSDADEMLPTARHEFENQQRLAEIKKRYQQALRAMNAGKWQEARSLFTHIKEQEPGFEETDRLLARVEAELSRQEALRQLREQVGILYEQAISLARARQWRQALEKIKEIESLDPQFADPEGIAVKAKAEIAREEKETQRQNELASLYAEAVRLLRAGQYQDALEKWSEVQAIQPGYSDHKKVQNIARKKLAAQARQGTERKLSRRMIVTLGSLGLVIAAVLVVLGFSKPGFVYAHTFGESGVAYIADTDHFYNPEGIGVDSAGNLWVAETLGSRALKYSQDGSFLMSIGTVGSFYNPDETHFGEPSDIAIDKQGNVWVADRSSFRVVQYDSEGNFLMQLGINGEDGEDNTHFAFPVGVAIDSAGNIYVSDEFNHRIQVFDNNGVYKTTIGVTGVPGSDNAHFRNPYRLAIDDQDNLYVVELQNHRVQIFDRNHKYRATLGVSNQPGSDTLHLSGPRGVAVDINRIYVADSDNNRIQIFNRNTLSPLSTLGAEGTGNYEFKWPSDVAVDSDGSLYVSDAINHRVQKFNSNRVYVQTFGTTGVPYLTDSNHFSFPYGVAIDDEGNIGIVEDQDRGHRFIKLDASGNPLFTIGEPGVCGGDDDAHLANPGGVAFDNIRNIYIADTVNHRIQIFNSDGTWRSRLGTGVEGTGSNEFTLTTGVAVDKEGRIYVTDLGNHRVQIFNSFHNYVATLGVSGQAGSDNEHFDQPMDVEVDVYGNIYVADTFNHRVQKFNRDHAWEMTLGVAGECGEELDHFCLPYDVTVDAQGVIFVADMGNNRVQIFTKDGAYMATIGGNGSSKISGLFRPYGVSLDADGNLYVADTANHRIQKFSPSRFANILNAIR